MSSQGIDWLTISPPLCLVAGALVVLLAVACWPNTRTWLPTATSLAAVVAAIALMVALRDGGQTFCVDIGREANRPCSWRVDHVTLVWWVIVLIGLGLVVLLLHPLVADGSLPASELHLLLLASATGAMGLAASGDLITLLVCVETVSLPAFAMVALRRDRRGAEAALKFFLVSVVATAFTLLGISLVYGATGTVVAGPVHLSGASGRAVTPLIGVGMTLTVVALAFKIAAVPFQAWVPDTYVGAPVPIAAYLSVVSKAAGLAGFALLLVRFFPAYRDTWRPVVAVAAAMTMTLGNLAALRQRHAVRLLAWSSVAQAGYLLVPLAAGGRGDDAGALQSYALMYAVVNLGAFGAVLAAGRRGATTVGDMAGLARAQPLVGASLAFALLCLAGLPPGVIGLVAKVVIFQSAIDASLSWLAVVMAVNVAIGLVYYLRFLATVLRASVVAGDGPTAPAVARIDGSPEGAEWPIRAVLVLTLAVSVVLSVLPGLLLSPVYP
jgi:NADH-quinone oxidoreductase subunit N